MYGNILTSAFATGIAGNISSNANALRNPRDGKCGIFGNKSLPRTVTNIYASPWLPPYSNILNVSTKLSNCLTVFISTFGIISDISDSVVKDLMSLQIQFIIPENGPTVIEIYYVMEGPMDSLHILEPCLITLFKRNSLLVILKQ
jgi:hypothetical protein